MDETPLLREGLLSSPSFMRDLKSFLGLSEDVLLAISELGNQPDGFVGFVQSQTLNARFGIPVDKAMRDLRIAKFLYDRVTELDLDTANAAHQLAAMASGLLEDQIPIDDKRRNAIKAVLSFKPAFEIYRVKSKSVNDSPHFVGINGSWNIKPIRTREGETLKVPIMGMSIVWHDSSGNHHEAFFHMDDQDWDELSSKISALSDSRKELEDLL